MTDEKPLFIEKKAAQNYFFGKSSPKKEGGTVLAIDEKIDWTSRFPREIEGAAVSLILRNKVGMVCISYMIKKKGR